MGRNDHRKERRVQSSEGTLDVDGARIHYQTVGAGSPLLIVQGGIGDAGASEQLAEVLAERHRVLSYDRRGLSRSAVGQDAPPVDIARHADDAAALLAALTEQPAFVVGASIGALIGLHLAARHPERVATLVAHEPPMSAVFRDAGREAAMDEVARLAEHDLYAAIARMAALTGAASEVAEPGARQAPSYGNLRANLDRFFRHDFGAVRESTLDASGVAAIPDTRIVLTGGSQSADGWEHRCARLLAEQSGREFVEIPGGHGALTSHPFATAAALRDIAGRPA